jgi:hypothetical protein
MTELLLQQAEFNTALESLKACRASRAREPLL